MILSRLIINRHLFVIITLFCLAIDNVRAATYTVTNTDDSNPFIPIAGSLRWAINQANSNSGADIIAFNITPSVPSYTVTLSSQLPFLTETVTIDGTSQPGYIGNPIICINGNNLSIYGLVLINPAGSNTVIKGLFMTGFAGSSLAAIGVTGGANNVMVTDNVVGGNPGSDGIYISGANFTIVKRNKVGVNIGGAGALPNRIGILVNGDDNIVGSSLSSDRNISSGNTYVGIAISGNNNTILGNLIGTALDGYTAIPNLVGMYAGQNNNVIDNNTISGNTQQGISVFFGSNITIKGNKIGVALNNLNALIPVGNGDNGIFISNVNYTNLIIGGVTSAEANLIGGNLNDGIFIQGSQSVKIKGNYIGTDTSGAQNLGNVKNGVRIRTFAVIDFIHGNQYFHAKNNVIGGTLNGEFNRIAYNGESGINIKGDTISSTNVYANSNVILHNKIYGNSIKAIELNYSSVIPGNNTKPKPIISSYDTTTTTLSGTAQPQDKVEIFGSTGGQNANAYLATVNANASGTWSVNVASAGYSFFTATATDALGLNSPDIENTSELGEQAPGELPCHNCIGSFAPEPGKKYIVSAWSKEAGAPANKVTYDRPQIFIDYTGPGTSSGPFIPKGTIIDGWQRIEEEFTIPPSTTHINIRLQCQSGNCFFDDLRIHPFDGSMKTFVFDPVTLRLAAELDERNYATLYEYDEEEKLIRVKKETERGVMTIQEKKNSMKKQ